MQPLANAYPAAADLRRPEPFYPLRLLVCAECFLVQVEETVSPEQLFRDYAYFSSYSDSWLKHAETYAGASVERFGLHPGSRVVEVASNDGYLLRFFARRGIQVLGIDPATNVAAVANANGIPTLPEFFGRALATRLAGEDRQADLLVGNNVLAHVPDLNDFVAGLAALLKPHGVLTMEFPHLLRLMDENQFDTIYHEHLSYFSVAAVVDLASRHGLRLIDVRRVGVHGGSIRVFMSRHGDASPEVKKLVDLEEQIGLRDGGPLGPFVEAVRRQREDLRRILGEIRSTRHVAGYGAPAKGNTLLNYCEIDRSVLDFIVDRSPLKHGLLTPGTHIPVEPPERLMASDVRDTLLLAWNFADEILRQQQDYRSKGGRFIVPIPTPRVL